MITKHLEKEFRIEVIASLIENTLLSNKVTENDLYELCSFISGEEINNLNFHQKGNLIRMIMLDLQPELNSINIKITNNTNDSLFDVDIKTILYFYNKKFGETYTIKSIKKCLVKSLKNTNI